MSDTATQFTVPAVAQAVAATIGDRELLVQGDQRFSYAQIVERSNRLAAYLHSRGLGCHTERSALAGHEVGQDLLGLYAYNGNEFVEALLGAFAGASGPVQRQLPLRQKRAAVSARGLGCDRAGLPRRVRAAGGRSAAGSSAAARADSDRRRLRQRLGLRRSRLRDRIIGSSPSKPPSVQHSPDDLYVLYTGGTTGMPKGVLWRQHDIFMTSFGGRNLMTGEPSSSVDEIVARVADSTGTKLMILPPLIHGAAQWSVMTAITTGQTVVFPSVVDHLDADEVVRTIERERVIGGDRGRRRDGAAACSPPSRRASPTCRRWPWSPTAAPC